MRFLKHKLVVQVPANTDDMSDTSKELCRVLSNLEVSFSYTKKSKRLYNEECRGDYITYSVMEFTCYTDDILKLKSEVLEILVDNKYEFRFNCSIDSEYVLEIDGCACSFTDEDLYSDDFIRSF